MGEVYRATDTKLGRDVALKVLPAEMASSPERLERFQREAKALATLDHPGVVGVYSVEEADGVHFLTMQLVEGEPLDRVVPEGGLPGEAGPRDRHGPGRGAGRRSRQGHRPPGPEARQRHGDEGRTGQGPGFRAGQDHPGRRRGRPRLGDGHRRPDPRGRGDGDGAVHVPGAGFGPEGRPADRHLLTGHPALRDGDGTSALPGSLLGRARLGHSA